MPTRIFDNIKVISLLSLLDEGVVGQRYYALIPYKEQIVSTLLSLGINDKYDYISASQKLRDEFIKKANIESWIEEMFVQFLHLYDFRPRRLLDSDEIGFYLEPTVCKTMKSSGDYLKYCIEMSIEAASEAMQLSVEKANELFCLCDLMRLPGVKWLRAWIYYSSGCQSVQAFSKQTVEQMRETTALYIQEYCPERAVPLPKELATQIAVAVVIPNLCVY